MFASACLVWKFPVLWKKNRIEKAKKGKKKQEWTIANRIWIENICTPEKFVLVEISINVH